MSNVHELFHVYLHTDGLVEVEHDGLNSFDDQKEGTYQELIDYLREQVHLGKTEGWTPYANFESAFKWRLLDEDIVFNIPT